MPVRPPGAVAAAAPAGAHLAYFGGPVISSVQAVMVLWGSGTYQPFVQQTTSPSLATFYRGVTDSPYMDWLFEYDTDATPVGGGTGTRQAIGRGSYLDQFSIAPSAAASGPTISDAGIQAELLAQIDAGHLPSPAVDAGGQVATVYLVHFPKGKTIAQGGSSSCVAGGFCAYHGTFVRAGRDVYYAVLPDMSAGSGCDRGCGGSPVAFENQTAVAAHELVEAVTDPAVGLATDAAPPLAWYDVANNAEIGDLCNGLQGAVVGGDGVSYVVQQEWSNAANACVTTRNVAPPDDFSIALAPAAQSTPQGSAAAYAVSTAVTRGSARPVALSTSALPPGLAASFDPGSVTAGEGSTLTIAASGAAAVQTTAFTVRGTTGSVERSASASLTVTAHVSIAPAAPILAPRAQQTFAASGGSGTGYAWSLATNASGGTIGGATGAYRAGATGSATDVVQVKDSLGNAASASVAVTAGVSVVPAASTLEPGARQTFAASGGSGAGYSWSLATNGSGGMIDGLTGAYQAGASAGVTDVVQATDSLGNLATASVTVVSTQATAPRSGCGCGAGGGDPLALLLLGLLAGARWRLRGATPRPG
jgi:hypothetical protein